jgi:APA family basic amino acid/polyamine antiporter
LAGLGCALAGFCYAEFAALAPSAGSAYSYAYVTIGELLAWLIGWALVLEYAVSGSVVAGGWAEYLNALLKAGFGEGAALPAHLCEAPVKFEAGEFVRTGNLLNLPAAAVILAVTAVLVVGIRESARTNAVPGPAQGRDRAVRDRGRGLVHRPGNWTGIRPRAGRPGRPGQGVGAAGQARGAPVARPGRGADPQPVPALRLSGVLAGAAAVFFSYLGFDAVSTAAEEAKRPARDVPVGILGSLLICTVLYIGVAAVLTGMEPYTGINSDAAVARRVRPPGGRRGGVPAGGVRVVAVGALAGMTSVCWPPSSASPASSWRWPGTGCCRTGVFGAVHPRFGTPHRSTVLVGAVTAAVAAVVPPTFLEDMISLGTLSAFTWCAWPSCTAGGPAGHAPAVPVPGRLGGGPPRHPGERAMMLLFVPPRDER